MRMPLTASRLPQSPCNSVYPPATDHMVVAIRVPVLSLKLAGDFDGGQAQIDRREMAVFGCDAGIGVDQVGHDGEAVVARFAANHQSEVELRNVIVDAGTDRIGDASATWPSVAVCGRYGRQPGVRRDGEGPTGRRSTGGRCGGDLGACS